MLPECKHIGFWGGYVVVTFVVIEYILKSCKTQDWTAPLIGTRRQGIMVTTAEGCEFFIDNQHGDGLPNVMTVSYCPIPTRQVHEECIEIVNPEVPPYEWIRQHNPIAILKENNPT